MLSDSLSCFAPAAASLVGSGFREVPASTLVEKGDEYRGDSGYFVPFSLDFVGRPVPAGMLVRRVLRRNPLSF